LITLNDVWTPEYVITEWWFLTSSSKISKLYILSQFISSLVLKLFEIDFKSILQATLFNSIWFQITLHETGMDGYRAIMGQRISDWQKYSLAYS